MVKERKDIDIKDTWNTEDIYANHDLFLKDLDKLYKLNDEIVKMKGHLTESSESLEHFYRVDDEISNLFEKASSYTHLNHDADMTNEGPIKDEQLVVKLYEKCSVDESFIDNEILDAGKDKIMSLLTTNYLKDHKFNLEKLFRAQEHILSAHDEELISKIIPAVTSNNEAMNLLKDTDLRFPIIKNDKGEDEELTLTNYSTFITSKNREVRKNAMIQRDTTLSKYRDVFTELLYRELKSSNAFTKIRNYKDNLNAAMFSNNLDESIYYNLIKEVNNNLEPLHKYQSLRKEILGLKDYASYDMGVSLNNVKDTEFSFEEAKDLVLKATSVLGEDYTNNLKKAFDNRWIDKYSSHNKMSGGYTSDCYPVHPYVLLNYQGKYDDVSTLAHELGHAMHSYYSDSNPIYKSNYTIFVAEVASTTNELLLANYILKNSDNKDLKLEVLNNLIDTIDGTIYRQTMFAEFEDFLYKTVEKDEPFTPDILGNKYLELMKKYNGPEVNTIEIGKDSWSRVDHFYYGYYVYKYATSMSASLAIVKHILSGDQKAKENYLKFLTLGGTMYPLDELKVAGVDLSDPKVIDDALSMFDEYVNEYKKLIKKWDVTNE